MNDSKKYERYRERKAELETKTEDELLQIFKAHFGRNKDNVAPGQPERILETVLQWEFPGMP